MKLIGLDKTRHGWFEVVLDSKHQLLYYGSKLDVSNEVDADFICAEGPFPTIGGMLTLKQPMYFKRQV